MTVLVGQILIMELLCFCRPSEPASALLIDLTQSDDEGDFGFSIVQLPFILS